MKVLVVGASGLVGRHLLVAARQRGHQAVGTFWSHPESGLLPLTVTDAEAVERIIAAVEPETVMLSAAEPNVDYCETHPDESRRVNVQGLGNVVAAAARAGRRLVFFSSDYVFNGAAGPYREDNPPSPLSEYGRQKLAGERLVAAADGRALTIRTTGVYGAEPRGKNFVMRLCARLGAGEVVPVASDQYGNPTSAADLAAGTIELVERGALGVYNFGGPERLSRVEFARLIAEIFGLDAGLIAPRTTAELALPAPRPLQAGFILDKVRAALGRDTLPPRSGLAALKKTLATINERL